MNMNKVTTAAALAFAGFAVWYITRGAGAPIAAISPQPAQQRRDAGLAAWLNDISTTGQQFGSLMTARPVVPFSQQDLGGWTATGATGTTPYGAFTL